MPKTRRLLKTKKTPGKKKKKFSFPSRQAFGFSLILLGFILLFYIPTIPVKADRKEPIIAGNFQKNKEESKITKVSIPNAGIDVEVKPAKLIKGYWETSENSASHGEGSANPGEGKNVVVFAHARDGLFFNLKNIGKNETVHIFTNGKQFEYRVVDVKAVYPNEVETVAPGNREMLTLFTCSGFFDEKRLVVKAVPVQEN